MGGYKEQIKDSIENTVDEITVELEKAERLLVEVDGDDDIKDIKSTVSDALVIIQDLLYDLR